MTTDTSEKGLESLIVADLETAGWIVGSPSDYNREYCIDLTQLQAFIEVTQPKLLVALGLENDSPVRRKFLARLQGEVSKRGIIDVLRNGVEHGPHKINLFCGSPSEGNPTAKTLYVQNRFSVARQLRYSRDETQLALDLCLFINGLPIATFELKNRLTKQTVDDAIQQYKRDRSPREPLFGFGRCIVHFAMDDQEVRMCTHLKGKHSWFLPFNKGWNDGAGNPPNPHGLKTDYLWKEVLQKDSLTDIIENYAQQVEVKTERKGKKYAQIFPRYHQLDVVRKLLRDIQTHGVGKKYLIQHSAGSGKSNSIAWLAHQLIDTRIDGSSLFDSIIVVTDRRVLDQQIKDTIKQFSQVAATVGHADKSGDLRKFITEGKKIIISTVQKFPFVLDEIGDAHRDRKFAIIIDEAHSSQGGRTSAKMNIVLSKTGGEVEEETFEDQINRIMESRKMLANASYFAFTATPKNKTLEIFGEGFPEGDKIRHKPFHSYTMKQAIEEGFILDVLKHYTPVKSYYRLMKTIEDDPEFDTKKAQKKLRRYVESHEKAIRQKAEIMVYHFHDHVHRKIKGQARAMVVTSGVNRAIKYYMAISTYLEERKSPYRALVAFSGEREFNGRNVSEAILNGIPESKTKKTFKEDPYRFLVVAEKFQTGYDEPLLHTMYVDKILSGIKAVQTLSRLNRAHPGKYDTFVLDFMNDTASIIMAFSDYYRTTVLSDETDPNKLHDLNSSLDAHQVYSDGEVEELVRRWMAGEDRDRLDPILDGCVAVYNDDLDEDGQVDFKGKAKAFVRTYGFLASILPYTNASWEKLSVFLNFLIPKLPAPKEEDLARGILEAIDMDSYRAEVQATRTIPLEDKDGEIDPIPVSSGGRKPEPEMDYLSSIVRSFNDMFGDLDWKDSDRIARMVAEDIPSKVAADPAYRNAIQNSDEQNARIEHDKALEKAVVELLADDTELFKQFSDNESFRKWVADTVFIMTYAKNSRTLREERSSNA